MRDHLIAECKSCGHHVRISPEHGGRRAKCPKCDGIIEIPTGETSVRLRSDRELTREARAKAGRGPESDHALEAVTPIAGRHTSIRSRRVVPRKSSPGRTWAMIATLVATAAIIGGILIIMFKKAPGDTPSAAPPAAPAAPAPKPAPPPLPPDPNAAAREEIMSRFRAYLTAFNTNDLNKMAPFYACDLPTLTKSFGKLAVGTEVDYSKFEAKSIEFAPDEIKMTLIVDRVLADTESKTSTTEEGVERVLVWTQKEGKWVISSPPEP